MGAWVVESIMCGKKVEAGSQCWKGLWGVKKRFQVELSHD